MPFSAPSADLLASKGILRYPFVSVPAPEIRSMAARRSFEAEAESQSRLIGHSAALGDADIGLG